MSRWTASAAAALVLLAAAGGTPASAHHEHHNGAHHRRRAPRRPLGCPKGVSKRHRVCRIAAKPPKGDMLVAGLQSGRRAALAARPPRIGRRHRRRVPKPLRHGLPRTLRSHKPERLLERALRTADSRLGVSGRVAGARRGRLDRHEVLR